MSTRREAFAFTYAALLSGGLYLFLAAPAAALPVERVWSVMGAGCGLLLALHVVSGAAAFDLLFGRKRERASNRLWFVLWMGMGGLAVASVIPALAPVSVPLLFLLHAVVFLRSRLWSIENILFQNFLFYWCIAEIGQNPFFAGSGFSERIQSSSMLALVISTGLIMHSGGWEKWKSPLWRAGGAVDRFLGQKHLLTALGHRVQAIPSPWSGLHRLSGRLVMWCEFLLLPSMANRIAFLCVVLVLLLFSLSLFLIVDISFIGQTLAIQFGSMAVFGIAGGVGGYALPEGLHWEDCLFLLSFLMTCFVVHFPEASRKFRLGWVQHFFSGVSSPIRVFTERHLEGVWLYRFDVMRNDGGRIEIPQVFGEDGGSGKLQRWRPRYFQSVMYLLGRSLSEAEASVEGVAGNELVKDLGACFVRMTGADEGVLTLKMSPACGSDKPLPVWREMATIGFSDRKVFEASPHGEFPVWRQRTHDE